MRSAARRHPARLVATLVVAATLLGACRIPLAGAAPARSHALSGVHVAHPPGGAPYLADAAGHAVLLRGVNDNSLVQYSSTFAETVPPSRADFAEMAALGFDFVRLPVSWSRIMPEPGVLDHAYLAEVHRVVRWAEQEGLGVLVDLHQDNYSAVAYPGHESDGAPAWATVTDGTPCTPVLTTTACALAAFRNFWADTTVDGRPLQQWYLEAAVAVARAAGAAVPAGRSRGVVGVELMNEPWPGGPSPFEQTSLYPFYERMISGLRAAGISVPLWFEPSIARDLTNDALPQAQRFSSDPNLVYAVHVYTGVFSPPYGAAASAAAMRTSYADAVAEAARFGVPLEVDEYGSSATPSWNAWLAEQLSLQDADLAGSAFWLWKQQPGFYGWSVVNPDGSLRTGTLRAQLLGQPHVDTVPGRLVATSATAGSLSATVDGPGGVALLWGGTVVRRGGPSVTARTLRQARVDGRPVPARCTPVGFATAAVALGGCLLAVPVPPGRHVVTATP